MRLILVLIAVVLTKPLRKSSQNMSSLEWKTFSAAVGQMKALSIRDPTDPLGFTYQANIHGWYQYDGSLAADQWADARGWHQCQHGHSLFLVWHRMFLYFQERILRRLSGDPQLTIPYWDYSRQRSLPLPFRRPANNSNPLYTVYRCPHVNAGRPLPSVLVNPQFALKSTFFATNQSAELNVCHSLGGGRLSAPAFQASSEGLLEQIPHNNVHVLVGGPDGHLSDNCRAALDPLFLSHHAMIDRTWESWSRVHPITENETLLNQSFEFFDEHRTRVVATVRDFMSLDLLDYEYDSLLPVRGENIRFTENPKLFISVSETNSRFLTIDSDSSTIELKIRPEFRSRFEQLARGQVDNVRTTLQISVQQMAPDIVFYVNLSSGISSAEEYFVGAVSYIESKCVPKTRRQQSLAITNCFDVTETLETVLRHALRTTGVPPSTLRLTFVGKSCDSTVTLPPRALVLNHVFLIHFFH